MTEIAENEIRQTADILRCYKGAHFIALRMWPNRINTGSNGDVREKSY